MRLARATEAFASGVRGVADRPRRSARAALLAALTLVGGALAGCLSTESARSDPDAPAGTTQGTQPSRMASATAVAVTVGYSVDRRPIRAYVVGGLRARRSMLVVGCVHGNEPAGEAITRRLRHEVPPPGVSLWLVDEFNPDGCRADTRQNAHGVDLNRNSPWHWRPLDRPGGVYYSGPRPLSEPESRAINRLVLRLRPAVSIWYHQHAALVDSSSGGSLKLERLYATRVGLPLRDYGVYPGSITSWQDTEFPHDTAFVVELPAGALTSNDLNRHAAAVLALARAVAMAARNRGTGSVKRVALAW